MRSRRTNAAFWVAALGAYALLAMAFTWPLPAHFGSAFPHDAGDPAFTAWVLWWNAHALPLTATWWNAPMFWPATDMFALSEHMVGISLVATPLQWLGATPIAAFNLAFLLSFPLTAIAAHALAFTVTRRHDASALAALVFGFSPYRVSQLPHLQMLWMFGLPLALAALHRFIDTGRKGWLVAFGVAWLVQALSNGYMMLFVPVLFACWMLWFVARRRADAAAIATAFVVASLPLVPFAVGYQRVHSRLNLLRHVNEIQQFSADMLGLFAASPDLMLWHILSRFSFPEAELFPGLVAVVISVAGLAVAAWRFRKTPDVDRFRRVRRMCAGLGVAVAVLAVSPLVVGPWKIGSGPRVLLSIASPPKPLTIAVLLLAAALMMTPTFAELWRRRSPLAFYGLACVLMYVLAFGPGPRAGGVQVFFRAPYEWLMMAVPGFSSVRVPARFAMLGVLCLAIVAAIAFARLTASAGRRTQLACAVTAGAVIFAESWPRVGLAQPAPPIRALAGGAAPIVELPIGITERDIAAVYRSMAHGRAVANGYSGYIPPHYLSLVIALASGDASALDALVANGPLTVVVDRGWEFDKWSALVETHPQHRIVSDEGPWRIYEVTTPEAPAAPAGDRLQIMSVSPSVGAADIARALDGNLQTNWNSLHAQRGGEEIAIDLGRNREVAAVRMELGPYRYDFPRALTVECAADGGAVEPCWSGSAAALAVRGALDDPIRAPVTIPIGRRDVRRIVLRQTGSDRFNGWSIAELQVLGR